MCKKSKLFHKHSELVVKYSTGLTICLQQCILELVFYGDLNNTFKQIVGKPYIRNQFKKIGIRYYKIITNIIDSMRQSECLFVNPITVYSHDFPLVARRWARPRIK